MSRTRRGTDRINKLEVVKRADGHFDLYLDKNLDQSKLDNLSLVDQLCVRFGYCGQEFEELMLKLDQEGQATIIL